MLKGINLNFESCEKIDIVGRIDARKSFLILGLFRIIESTQGNVIIDSIDISTIDLRDLRKRLAIIL